MSQSDKAFHLAIGLYACDDSTMHDANAIKDIVAALESELDQQRTRAEAAEAELRTANQVIATLEECDRIREETVKHMRSTIESNEATIRAQASTIASHERMAADMARMIELLGGAK